MKIKSFETRSRTKCLVCAWESSPCLNFFPLLQESDVDWIFDPAIDATLEAHAKKRTRDEAFSDDDNVSSDSIFFFKTTELSVDFFGKKKRFVKQNEVLILGPLGYEPSTLSTAPPCYSQPNPG